MRNKAPYILLFFFVIGLCSSLAQEHVNLIPPKKYKGTQIGGQASIVTTKASPYSAGGGFWIAYNESLKSTNKIEMGVHYEYNFMGSSTIYFDDGDDYFSNSGGIMRLNYVLSTHPLRFNKLDIFQEFYLGGLLSTTTSTYYADKYDDEGNLNKFRIRPAWDFGAGLGVRYKRFCIKGVYHFSPKFNQVDVKNIYYENNLIYSETRTTLGVLNIYLGILIN